MERAKYQNPTCSRGHPRTPENSYILRCSRQDKERLLCKICNDENTRRRREKMRHNGLRVDVKGVSVATGVAVPLPSERLCDKGHPIRGMNIMQKGIGNGRYMDKCRICHNENRRKSYARKKAKDASVQSQADNSNGQQSPV